MSVDFVTWLFKITKRNPLYVNVLRNFFFLLLTRNNGYKTALYLYGSESEINILLKICEFILTTEGCIFTNLSSLNRVSIRNSLYHVNLIVFKNINFGKQRKSIFKAIINSEPIEFQFGKEYKPQSELNSLVLITSNQVWKNKNATIDYIIYLPIAAYAPAEASENKNLLIDDSFEASLSGFINFVLDNPKENLNLFSDIRQLNYKIDSYEESGGTFDGSTLVDPDSLLNLDYFKDYIKPTVGLENNASPFTSKISKRNFSTTRSSLINLNNKIILSTRSALNSQQLHVTVLQKFYFRIGLKLISNIGIFYNGQKCNLWINETPDKKTYVPGLRPDPKIDKYYNQGENFILPGSNDSSFDQKLLEILIKLNNCGGKHNDSCVLYFLTECNYSVDEKQKNILKQIIEQYSIPFEEQKDIYNPDKHLVLIYNVIFYYEKREFFDTVHLNFYKDRYKNAVLYKINNLNYNFFHTRHLNYEEKIILKVFRSLDLETFISWYSNKNIQRVFNEKYLYDKTSYSWYKFKNDIWVKLYFSEFKESIFEDLKEYGIFKYNMTEDIRRKLYYYLEKNLMINMNKLNIINKNFIPFKNGVLNLNNSPSMLYSYSNFTDKRFFFKFNVDFDSKAKMSIDFVKWLLKISKKNPFYMNIIRNFFFLLVTRNYEYKIALNLYDLTNSEINIFLNICENIVCSNGYISMNLSDINDIIKRRYIYNKNLIIVKDMESKNFKKTAILKKIINSEKIKINFSKFYKLTSNVNLNSLVIIISNHICKGKERNIKNIIYLPITGEKEISLQADLLKASLPGFINWVLDNPKENLNLFNDIRRLNYKIDCLEESKGTFDGSSLVDPNSLLDLDYFKNYIKRRS
jgi:hypothetical protein